MQNSIDKYKADIESQINYAVMKYGGNLPPSVAKAQAKRLAYEAMKSYTPSKGNVKTYLSSRLQKLSRIAYKATTPMVIPENRLMHRQKIRDFIDDHRDTFGVTPHAHEISKALNIPKKDVEEFFRETGAVNSESLFENIQAHKPSYLSYHDIIHSLPVDLRSIGEDIYLKHLSEQQIIKKHKLGRTTYFKRKKAIDQFISEHSEYGNIYIK